MNPTRRPKFTVIIPTRERCDVLGAAIRTCTEQNYDDLEIVVSDNFSQDATKEVVSSFRDGRIRYVNPGRRLGMSQHWEFALSHAQGDYVTIVGDDDGLLPGALSALDGILRETGIQAISWRWASYFWPNCINAPSRNLMFVPLGDGLERRSARAILTEVLAFRRGYEELPFLYKGMISMQLVEEVRRQSGGVFFNSMTPDVYSAIALSLVARDYLYSKHPFSMNGTSGHSNGASQFQLGGDQTAAKTFQIEDNIPFHPDLAFAPSMPILVGECFLRAREVIANARFFDLDLERMLDASMRQARRSDCRTYESVAGAVKAIAQRYGLVEDAAAVIARNPRISSRRVVGLRAGINPIRMHHVVDCADYGVRDIYRATLLCGFVLDAHKSGLKISLGAFAKSFLTLAWSWAMRRLGY